MPDAWGLEETRLVQVRTVTSAINALYTFIGDPGPPRGKLWTVFATSYMPSVAETQVVCWEKYDSNASLLYGLKDPVSLALNPMHSTCIEQGMFYLLLPGEYLVVRRGSNTAGSTMSAWMQFVETDQPLYEYIEPQIRRSIYRVGTEVARRLGGGGRPGGPAIPPAGGEGGGGRER